MIESFDQFFPGRAGALAAAQQPAAHSACSDHAPDRRKSRRRAEAALCRPVAGAGLPAALLGSAAASAVLSFMHFPYVLVGKVQPVSPQHQNWSRPDRYESEVTSNKIPAFF